MRTVTIYIPNMQNEACAKVVVSALMYNPQNPNKPLIPRKNIHPNIDTRTVEVTYDAIQRSIKNLEFTIANAGFTANHVPADPKAVNKLPKACGIPCVPDNARAAAAARTGK